MDSQHPENIRKGGRFKKVMRKSLIFILLLLAVYYFVCGITYSEGTRSGVLTKISKRGYVFKTCEGELNVGGFDQMGGTIMPQSIFYFSVRQDSIFHQLEMMQGKRLVLHYKEVIKSFFWQGESNYFIYQISVVK